MITSVSFIKIEKSQAKIIICFHLSAMADRDKKLENNIKLCSQ